MPPTVVLDHVHGYTAKKLLA